jgi:hypothetical protein
MGIKTPRLIRDRCGVFYFRFIVPLSWRQTVGKTEIRRSLRTKDLTEARQTALLLSARMEALMVDRRFLNNPTLADFPHQAGAGRPRHRHARIGPRRLHPRGGSDPSKPQDSHQQAQISNY